MAVFWLAALLFSPSGARVVTEPTTIQFTYGIDETLFRPELTTGGVFERQRLAAISMVFF